MDYVSPILDMCVRVSQISTFVKKLMGLGLIWFSEALRVQWYNFFSRIDMLYADMGTTQSRIMSRLIIKYFSLESSVDLNQKMGKHLES